MLLFRCAYSVLLLKSLESAAHCFLTSSHHPHRYLPRDVEAFCSQNPVASTFLFEQCRADFLAGRVDQVSADTALR